MITAYDKEPENGMTGQDKRHAPRYTGELPVLLGSAMGVTRDYSTSGVYFYINAKLSKGDPADFTVIFNQLDAGRQMRVNCRGTVVRTKQEKDRLGVAVQLSSHTFGV